MRVATTPIATGTASAPAAAPDPAPGCPPTPAVRRLARHLGVELATVTGTGPGDAITRADVKAAARRPAPPDLPASPVVELRTRANREIPHYHVAVDVDLARAETWLAEVNADRAPGERVLRSALLVQAVARAAREHPTVNGTWSTRAFVPARAVHVALGLAGTTGAASDPVLVHADTIPLAHLSDVLRHLVARARATSAGDPVDPPPSDPVPPTITLQHFGSRGPDRMFGVVTPPQVAVVTAGRVTPQPCACDGTVRIHPRLSVALAGDHRVSDAATGSRFLARVDALLQDPERRWPS